MLTAERIELENEGAVRDGKQLDARGTVALLEPAGFRRVEEWGFGFKLYQFDRVSAQYLRQLEAFFKTSKNQLDAVCLITSGDLTSVGAYITVENPKIRVWDRPVLQYLINRHLEVLEPYFTEYKAAIDTMSGQVEENVLIQETLPVPQTRLEEFRARLEACPAGKTDFANYEKIGVELLKYLFPNELGDPHSQDRTLDGKQRRDVLFRNQRSSRFFQRIADKFAADFLIVDFKNYTDPVGPAVLEDVVKYTNKAIGKFVLVVSRQGAEETVKATQVRLLRDEKGVMVLPISDNHLLEMIRRKEREERPEDVLEDLLDETLRRY